MIIVFTLLELNLEISISKATIKAKTSWLIEMRNLMKANYG
jgi:hypothetical protein